MVPKLYLWFSDSVVWMQCAHGGCHTWNFNLLVSTLKYPLGRCWLLKPPAIYVPAGYVTARATDCTVLLNDDCIVTVIILFLCVINTCICNRLCIRVCVCVCARVCVLACRSQRFPAMFLWGSPSWLLTQEFPHWTWGLLFQWAFCLSLPSPQVTADRGTLLCGCGGLRSSWLHSKNYSLSHIHSPPLFLWWEGIHCIV